MKLDNSQKGMFERIVLVMNISEMGSHEIDGLWDAHNETTRMERPDDGSCVNNLWELIDQIELVGVPEGMIAHLGRIKKEIVLDQDKPNYLKKIHIELIRMMASLGIPLPSKCSGAISEAFEALYLEVVGKCYVNPEDRWRLKTSSFQKSLGKRC